MSAFLRSTVSGASTSGCTPSTINPFPFTVAVPIGSEIIKATPVFFQSARITSARSSSISPQRLGGKSKVSVAPAVAALSASHAGTSSVSAYTISHLSKVAPA